MNLTFIMGTAAELIKLHPLITRARGRGWTVRLLATGQSHANLIDQARDFGLDPRDFVWLVEGAKDLASSRDALRWFTRAIRARAPFDLRDHHAVVHGDTLSTLAGAWVAHRAGARVIHVEAGLRSGRLWNPFPEEVTRRLVSRLARVHVAPDDVAREVLSRARVRGRIFSSGGNTLMDAIRDAPAAEAPRDFALVNVHRFENLNSAKRWRAITEVLIEAAALRPLVFIAHPQTRAKLEASPGTLARLREADVELHDRLPFSRFVALLKSARLLISDGGSNQEECSYLGIPCLLLREETERREGLGANCILSRFDRSLITDVLTHPDRYRRPAGFAANRPSDVILDELARPDVST